MQSDYQVGKDIIVTDNQLGRFIYRISKITKKCVFLIKMETKMEIIDMDYGKTIYKVYSTGEYEYIPARGYTQRRVKLDDIINYPLADNYIEEIWDS